MADETIIPPAPEHENRAQERITQLSEKVRLEAEGRTKAEEKALAAESRASFAEGFADILGNHPAAKDHKDEIRAKTLAGIPLEDATFAVLGKAGKLGGTQTPVVPQTPPQVAGGSAVTNAPQTQKGIGEMSVDEKRAELAKQLVWS